MFIINLGHCRWYIRLRTSTTVSSGKLSVVIVIIFTATGANFVEVVRLVVLVQVGVGGGGLHRVRCTVPGVYSLVH